MQIPPLRCGMTTKSEQERERTMSKSEQIVMIAFIGAATIARLIYQSRMLRAQRRK
jgi:hypothetical protein